jgi:hypothetical protein
VSDKKDYTADIISAIIIIISLVVYGIYVFVRNIWF